jgi:hypothetical protein
MPGTPDASGTRACFPTAARRVRPGSTAPFAIHGRRGNMEGTQARVRASTRGHSSGADSLFLRGFRARDVPALPAVPASALDGKEGVNGSSPLEGFTSGLQMSHFQNEARLRGPQISRMVRRWSEFGRDSQYARDVPSRGEPGRPEARVTPGEFVFAALGTSWSWVLLGATVTCAVVALSPTVHLSMVGRLVAAGVGVAIGAVWLERTFDVLDFRRRYGHRTAYFEGWRPKDESESQTETPPNTLDSQP